jgi:general secretion pathway protein H
VINTSNFFGLKKNNGFTLIEIIVVVLIIGLVSGYVIINVKAFQFERSVESEASRLEQLLRYASSQAVVNSQDLGVYLNSEGYKFFIYGKNSWKELHKNSQLRFHAFYKNLALEIIADDQMAVPENSGNVSSRDVLTPQIIFASSGEINKFEIGLYDESESVGYKVRLSNQGAIEIVPLNSDTL